MKKYFAYLVAAMVDQTIARADKTNPRIPRRLTTEAIEARAMIGKRQYPRTEQANQKSNPTG